MLQNKRHRSGFRDWKPSQLPELVGKRYVITGGNSGIGFEAAKMLAAAGADITLACRNLVKAEQAKAKLRPEATGDIDIVEIDLSSLASVRTAAEDIRTRYDGIDGLINNAGIMQPPKTLTEDGFELQFGANHLGHFLWTGLLLDLVDNARGRIVTVSSLAHKFGRILFSDLNSERRYDPSVAYCQSKLANLMFAFELDRRLNEAGARAISIACHPGYSSTKLQSTGPSGFFNAAYKVANPLFGQPAYQGAIPTVLAAAGREAQRGGYYGPQTFNEVRGRVSDATVARRALDWDVAEKLWTVSEELVGLKYLSDR